MLPSMKINGVEYDLNVEIECVNEFDVTTYTSPSQMKVVNKCDSCHRFNGIPIELHSVEEMIAHGWITPVNKEETVNG